MPLTGRRYRADAFLPPPRQQSESRHAAMSGVQMVAPRAARDASRQTLIPAITIFKNAIDIAIARLGSPHLMISDCFTSTPGKPGRGWVISVLLAPSTLRCIFAAHDITTTSLSFVHHFAVISHLSLISPWHDDVPFMICHRRATNRKSMGGGRKMPATRRIMEEAARRRDQAADSLSLQTRMRAHTAPHIQRAISPEDALA